MDNLTESDEAATQSAKDVVAAEQIEDRIAELDATAFRWLARRREANIEIGRAFNELKKILGHGQWQPHFDEKFAKWIKLRTAERYMKRARKADADAKNDKLTIFKRASDEDAEEIRKATQQARAEMAAASVQKKENKDSRHIYKLPLRMTADEKQATQTLQTLPDWPRAEKEILALLRRLRIKYGVGRDQNGRHS